MGFGYDMSERLDRYYSLQKEREKRRKEIRADRWEAIKSWLGIFAFCISVPTFFIAALNSYYSVVLRHEHLGVVLTRSLVALPHFDTRLIHLEGSSTLEGTFFNSGNRGIALEGMTLRATMSPESATEI
jgi:hypothetical protein